jgi:predicted RNA-binding protein YlxR (DUF448 family)
MAILDRLALLYPDEDPLIEQASIPGTRIPRVIRDNNHRLTGRGAWVCRSEDCIRRLSKKNILERAFRRRVEISPSELQKLKDSCGNLLPSPPSPESSPDGWDPDEAHD